MRPSRMNSFSVLRTLTESSVSQGYKKKLLVAAYLLNTIENAKVLEDLMYIQSLRKDFLKGNFVALFQNY